MIKKGISWILWVGQILVGCALFALGFDLFLAPNSINAGGLSGLAMILVCLFRNGTVGIVTLVFNIPLFLLGWRSLGQRFFVGSLIGAFALSGFFDLFALLPQIATEPLMGAIYGGALTGAGFGRWIYPLLRRCIVTHPGHY